MAGIRHGRLAPSRPRIIFDDETGERIFYVNPDFYRDIAL
jgi:hypothetical protein